MLSSAPRRRWWAAGAQVARTPPAARTDSGPVLRPRSVLPCVGVRRMRRQTQRRPLVRVVGGSIDMRAGSRTLESRRDG